MHFNLADNSDVRVIADQGHWIVTIVIDLTYLKMPNKLEKERSASGMRQSLVTTNSARKFIIVPASTATAPSGAVGSAAVNIPPVTAIYSDNPPPVTGSRSGSLAVDTQTHPSNEDAANLSMGRSLKFHSMRSVRGKC